MPTGYNKCNGMKFWFTLGIVLFTTIVNAQPYDSTLFDNMHMRSIGPAGMSGRVTSIDVELKDPKHILAGTASGGVWESKNNGTTWDPIFDDQPLQAIGAVSFSQKNSDIIWVGTGEGNPRNSHTSGSGIYKSLDGGLTWECMGLEATKTIHRIIIDPNNPDVVYAGCMGSIWGANSERGVYKTNDGGKHWEQVLFVNDTVGCADLIIDPQNPNKIIAAMWHYHREPWFFTSGGEGSGLYITYDGGQHWKALTADNGLPEGILGRIGLTICHSKPNVLYALIESEETGLYRSDDGGEYWYLVNNDNIGNRPFYYADIQVDPINENRIYNLYSVVSKSEDGGETFHTMLPYSRTHPDHHAFWIHPNNPDHLIDGNDGGLNISMDGGSSWRFVENLPVGQWSGPSAVMHSGGIQNSDWQEVLFGDGFDVMPKAGNSRYGYAMYQGGNLHTYDKKTGLTQKIMPISKDSIPLRFNWNAPMAQNPQNPCGIYYGSQFLHKSLDCGQSWQIISPDLTTNDTTKQNQVNSGGLTIDATKAENYTTIVSIAPSPINENVIWVGTDDGNLWVTQNGGNNWNLLSTKKFNKICPEGAWIPQIVASPHNQEVAYVVVNDYRRNNWKPYLFKMTKYGSKFENLITEDDTIAGHVHCVIQDHKSKNLLFMGTERGLYYSTSDGQNWQKWTNNYPSVPTLDLKIHPRESDLIIGTFGRSAYILNDITPLRQLADNSNFIEDQQFKVFDSPDAYLMSFQQNPGMRFGADAHYRGSNISFNGKFKYYLKSLDPTDTLDSTVDWKNIKFYLFDVKGDTIRQLKTKADVGFNTLHWQLDHDGFRFPASPKPKKGDFPIRGYKVLAGNYTLIAHFGTHIDTAQIKVLPDPRVDYNFNLRKQQIERINAYSVYVKSATKAFDFLVDAKKEVENIHQLSSYLKDETFKDSVLQECNVMLKEIKRIQALYRLDPSFKGYDHVTIRLNNLIYNVFSYQSDLSLVHSPNIKLATNNAVKRIKEVVTIVNSFMQDDWTKYTSFINTLDFNLINTHEPIKIK